MTKTVTNDILGFRCKITATYGLRSWMRTNRKLVLELENHKGLRSDRTRFWEYPWVHKQIDNKFRKITPDPENPEMVRHPVYGTDLLPSDLPEDIIDIGAGDGSFSLFLQERGYNLTAVDNYEEGWKDLKSDENLSKLNFVNGNCLNLNTFKSDTFDVSILLSVIEHIPENMIYSSSGNLKTKEVVEWENQYKIKAIKEAVRVVKPGGITVVTSDILADFAPELNMNWEQLLGVKDFGLEHFMGKPQVVDDLFITDIPTHKGRMVSVGFVIEKLK